MAKRVADVVVETLQAAGVKRCWGVPGDTLNFVTDAIRSAWLFTESDHYRFGRRRC
jgi:thiamine pyrophosphate-dependent acetolactate synthase large subunit-like protein